MAYLARSQDSQNATIKWKFDFKSSGLRIKEVTLKCLTQVYENGAIAVELLNDTSKYSSNCDLIALETRDSYTNMG